LPNWLNRRDVEYFQSELIRRHGGLPGPAREDALEATLARPQHLLAYEPLSTIPRLAASYAYGFARNHCFPDGNKRIALASLGIFLMDNVYTFDADEVDTVVTIRAVAAGEMGEEDLAIWIEENSDELDESSAG